MQANAYQPSAAPPVAPVASNATGPQAAPSAMHPETPPVVPGLASTPKVAWLVLGLGALLALLGTAALVIAILLH
jgi:hypothetical protein